VRPAGPATLDDILQKRIEEEKLRRKSRRGTTRRMSKQAAPAAPGSPAPSAAPDAPAAPPEKPAGQDDVNFKLI
jgi:hypothetical protein